jgi:hypothetical protein
VAIKNIQSRETGNIGYKLLWNVYFWLSLWYSLTFICPVSCVPYVASFSGLYIFDCPFGILWRLFFLCLVYPMLPVSVDCIFLIAPLVFSDVYLSCVLCTLCCQFLWIVYFWLPLWYSLTFIVLCLVYPMLPVSLDCPFLIAPLVFSDVYLSCVLCTLCCQFLWIVYFWLPLWHSLRYTRHLANKRQRIPKGNQIYTIQRNWQHRVHKTQEK